MLKEKNNKIILSKTVTLIITVAALVGIVTLIAELVHYLSGQKTCTKELNCDNTCECAECADCSGNALPYYDIFEDKVLYNIYSVNNEDGSYMIIGYQNRLYYIDSVSMNDIYSCAYELTVNGIGKRINKKTGYYKCEPENEEAYGANIVRLDINPNEITKVIVKDYPLSTDVQYAIYFIHDNGVVDYYHADGLGGVLKKNVFKGYKIMTLSQECIKSGEYVCNETQLTLKLKDGSTKVVTDFKFE